MGLCAFEICVCLIIQLLLKSVTEGGEGGEGGSVKYLIPSGQFDTLLHILNTI